MRKIHLYTVALLIATLPLTSFNKVSQSQAQSSLATVSIYRNTTLSDGTPAILCITISTPGDVITDVRLFYASDCLQIPTDSYTGYLTKHGWGYYIHSFYVYPTYLPASFTDGAATTGVCPCDAVEFRSQFQGLK